MLNSSVLDVAIGVVFVFLLLSIFATAINEAILSLLNKRGKFLLKGIETLLDNLSSKDPAAAGLVSKIYNHGQVYGLFEGPFDPAKGGNLPSYIPSRNFAIALLDSIAQPFSEMSAAAPNPIPGAPQAITQPMMRITAAFKTEVETLALNEATKKIGIPLASMITMAGDDALKLQKSLEDWFNSGMDRVSGHYKYYTQKILLVIGFVIAITMNADTIHIVQQLSNDATLRQSLVTAAGAYKPAAPAAAPTTDQPAMTLQQHLDQTTKAFDGVKSLGLPIGWPAGPPDPVGGEKYSTYQRFLLAVGWVFSNPSMILGWLFTAIAISLGAPFWFDTLNKIMVIRSTIKPTEKSQDEGSKDKPKT